MSTWDKDAPLLPFTPARKPRRNQGISYRQALDIAGKPHPREAGAVAAEACAGAAERRGFDTEGAAAFILEFLRRTGPASGESLTNQAKAAGFTPGEDRAFGAVIARLSRRKLIVPDGYARRAKGHGSAGATIWRAI